MPGPSPRLVIAIAASMDNHQYVQSRPKALGKCVTRRGTQFLIRDNATKQALCQLYRHALLMCIFIKVQTACERGEIVECGVQLARVGALNILSWHARSKSRSRSFREDQNWDIRKRDLCRSCRCAKGRVMSGRVQMCADSVRSVSFRTQAVTHHARHSIIPQVGQSRFVCAPKYASYR
jgi:hypothetical protein